MTIDQENEWFIGLGLNPESISDDDKKSMKQTHAFAFYKIERAGIKLRLKA